MTEDDTWFEREQLHVAAADADLASIAALLGAGVDPNVFDELGCTPLHYAAKAESIPAVRLLLAGGSDINAHDEARIGETALGAVAATCSIEMAQLLVGAGADPTISGSMRRTALQRASERKRGDGPAVFALLSKAARSGAR
jgi:ankyrin repeat protein